MVPSPVHRAWSQAILQSYFGLPEEEEVPPEEEAFAAEGEETIEFED